MVLMILKQWKIDHWSGLALLCKAECIHKSVCLQAVLLNMRGNCYCMKRAEESCLFFQQNE